MKRDDLIHHLRDHGCILYREGGNHTLFRNTANKKAVPLPRHQEIGDILAKRICRQLEIPELGK